MTAMIFTGANGRKPSTEARRHVYRMLAQALAHDMTDMDAWVLGGIEDEVDVRRLRIAAKKVYAELKRKGGQ